MKFKTLQDVLNAVNMISAISGTIIALGGEIKDVIDAALKASPDGLTPEQIVAAVAEYKAKEDAFDQKFDKPDV